MAYPIQWLDATFRNRTTAEQLLRPDLDSGLITSHDFHLASAFLPGNHRYWPVRTFLPQRVVMREVLMYALLFRSFRQYGCAAVASGGAAAYGRLYRKPPMSLNRSMLLATLAGFCGSVYGQFRRAKAHWTFTQELDDPVAFTQALENVNKRTGGVRPLAWKLQRAAKVAQNEDMHGNIPRPQEDSEAWTPGADQGASNADPTQDAQSPPSRMSIFEMQDALLTARCCQSETSQQVG